MCSKINFSWESQKISLHSGFAESSVPLPLPEFNFSPASTHDNGWVLETLVSPFLFVLGPPSHGRRSFPSLAWASSPPPLIPGSWLPTVVMGGTSVKGEMGSKALNNARFLQASSLS